MGTVDFRLCKMEDRNNRIYPCISDLNLIIILSTIDAVIYQAVLTVDFVTHRTSVLDVFFVCLVAVYLISILVDFYVDFLFSKIPMVYYLDCRSIPLFIE